MANFDELFTRRFGGGKRTYYFDVKRDTNGDKYIVISESTRKDADRKMRNRVMVWKEDFDSLFACMRELQAFVEAADDDNRTPLEEYLEMPTPAR